MRGSGLAVMGTMVLWVVGACSSSDGDPKDATIHADMAIGVDQAVRDAIPDVARDAASDGATDLGSDQGEPPPETVSEVIGSDGGTVSHPAGATVTIPAGALDEDEEISVTAYADARRLPRRMRSSTLGPGAVTLEPDGTVFAQPVTVTVPTSVALTPGTRFHLFVWNDTESRWEQTEFMATVDAGGDSYTAEVTHFTTYTGGTFHGPDGMFEYLQVNWAEADDNDHRATMENWANDFMRQRDRNPGRTTWALEDCCWELIGVQFVYDFKSGAYSYYNTKVVGKIVDFHWQEQTKGWSAGPPAGSHFRASIYMYWKSRDPEVKFNAPSRSTMFLSCYEGEKTSDLTLVAKCGEKGLPGVDVNFSLEGEGTIDTDNAKTDESGEAKTTYEAGDEWTKATVSADWTGCQQEPEQKSGKADASPICVNDCDGWQAVADITYDHAGEDIVWGFGDVIKLYVDFEVDKKAGTVTGGEGMATHLSTTVESAREHCSSQGLQTPNFIPGIGDGSFDGENVSFKLAAMNTGVNFVWHCQWPNQDPVDTPVAIYGFMEAAMMGKFLDLELPLNCGEFVTGIETDTDTDGTTPMIMSYKVSIDCHQRCE